MNNLIITSIYYTYEFTRYKGYTPASIPIEQGYFMYKLDKILNFLIELLFWKFTLKYYLDYNYYISIIILTSLKTKCGFIKNKIFFIYILCTILDTRSIYNIVLN